MPARFNPRSLIGSRSGSEMKFRDFHAAMTSFRAEAALLGDSPGTAKEDLQHDIVNTVRLFTMPIEDKCGGRTQSFYDKVC